MKIRIKKLSDNVIIPTRGSEGAAGIDIYANIDSTITIKPHETVKVPTGFATEMEKGTVGLIYARSGLATKFGLRPCQGVSVIDSDYRGEWFIPLHNDSTVEAIVSPNERIAQVMFMGYPGVELEDVLELTDTERGDGGFGSTGKQR